MAWFGSTCGFVQLLHLASQLARHQPSWSDDQLVDVLLYRAALCNVLCCALLFFLLLSCAVLLQVKLQPCLAEAWVVLGAMHSQAGQLVRRGCCSTICLEQQQL